MRHMYEEYGNKIYNHYAFVDAFNLDRDWYSEEHLGISLGCALLMIENHRTGMVWDTFMQNKYIQNWLNKCFDIKQDDGKRLLI